MFPVTLGQSLSGSQGKINLEWFFITFPFFSMSKNTIENQYFFV